MELSTCDAMVAAVAIHSDCETLWSEDMYDGLLIDGKFWIVNPVR
ncbi:PIN domain-containing protein [Sinorhizobium medicae]|nr:PIN domain-containing protein [Sinorhizobium medicae]WQO62875.1 PIN domain-containing protein [Sinorhizobium medicae]WQO89365.1 PIN domain-containing protein [Sinorhizobium medicae]